MNHQAYEGSYRAALETATEELTICLRKPNGSVIGWRISIRSFPR